MSPEGRRRARRRTTALGLAAVAVLLAVSAGVVSAKKPSPPPSQAPDPAIVYWSRGDLRVMNEDGSNDRLLVESAGMYQIAPDWSPDGSQVVWGCPALSFAADNPMQVVNLDGSGRTVISEGDGAPRWSPGTVLGMGEKIAFSRYVTGNPTFHRALFLMNPDGTGLVNLTNDPDVDNAGAAWSPEADRIAGVQDGDLVVYQLGLVDGSIQIVDTVDVTQAAADAGVSYPAPGIWMRWSNTPGTDEVVVRCGDGQIYIMDLYPPYEVIRVTDAADGLGNKTDMAWSPDDSRLILAVSGGAGKTHKTTGIWTIDLLTGRRTQLVRGDVGYHVAWWANPYGLEH